jgi:ribosomal protein S18 acetylase RimI-like enzyme
MDIIIRPVRTDECGKILELWRNAGSTPSITDTVDDLKKEMQSDGGLLLVAEYKGRIVGTVMGGWDGWRGNIYRLAVLPEYRLRGIGRRLVGEVEYKLAAKGARKISILVEKSEDTAVAFWKAMSNNDYNADVRLIRYAKSF